MLSNKIDAILSNDRQLPQTLMLCMHSFVVLLKCRSGETINTHTLQRLHSAECHICHAMSKHVPAQVQHSSVKAEPLHPVNISVNVTTGIGQIRILILLIMGHGVFAGIRLLLALLLCMLLLFLLRNMLLLLLLQSLLLLLLLTMFMCIVVSIVPVPVRAGLV